MRHPYRGLVARNQLNRYTESAHRAERMAKNMELDKRMQELRKSRGLSQEQLAEAAGVSRQAVSKWELGESAPELEKVLALSEFFGVTTDYLLKGSSPAPTPQKRGWNREAIGQVQYVVSAGLMAVGLLTAFGRWYDLQTDSVLWSSMLIQVAGVVWYFAGKIVFRQEAPFPIKMIDWALGLFLPCAMAVGFFFARQFRAYPTGFIQVAAFAALYGAALLVVYLWLKKAK